MNKVTYILNTVTYILNKILYLLNRNLGNFNEVNLFCLLFTKKKVNYS